MANGSPRGSRSVSLTTGRKIWVMARCPNGTSCDVHVQTHRWCRQGGYRESGRGDGRGANCHSSIMDASTLKRLSVRFSLLRRSTLQWQNGMRMWATLFTRSCLAAFSVEERQSHTSMPCRPGRARLCGGCCASPLIISLTTRTWSRLSNERK